MSLNISNDVFKHCKAGKTGTVIITTNSNSSCSIILDEGNLVAATTGRIRGYKAITELEKVGIKALSFKEGVQLPYKEEAVISAAHGEALFKHYGVPAAAKDLSDILDEALAEESPELAPQTSISTPPPPPSAQQAIGQEPAPIQDPQTSVETATSEDVSKSDLLQMLLAEDDEDLEASLNAVLKSSPETTEAFMNSGESMSAEEATKAQPEVKKARYYRGQLLKD